MEPSAASQQQDSTSYDAENASSSSIGPATKKRKTSYHCCVPRCNGDSRYHTLLRFHRIPGSEKSKKLRSEWLVKIRRDEGPAFKITSSTRVCSRHFKKEDYKPADNAGRCLLNEGAVPSVFDWTKEPKTRRKIIRQSDRATEMEINGESENELGIESSNDEMNMKAMEEELRKIRLELDRCKEEKKAALMQANWEKENAAIEISKIKKSTAEQLSISKFGLERFSNDNDSVKFYTGFPTYAHLKLFYGIIKGDAEKMRYCYASGEKESRPESRQMQPIDEMFMILVRLKLGLFEQDLADRFQIHVSTVSRKIVTWANYLYFMLGSQPIWPSKDAVQSYMPEEFKKLYPSTRIIIDCTEISVQTPSSLLLQSQLYSSYKSKTTLKGLVGITPHGAVAFVSALYTGGISDKEITRCCGILDLLEPGDSVMADKGFDVETLLEEKGVALNIPPFLEKQNQFLPEHVKDTKTIAKLRIHVERAIRRVKEFHFFDSSLPLASLGSLNQMFTVACLLTNFQGSLILRKKL